MPPSSNRRERLTVLLLIMRAFVMSLVERELEPNVSLNLALRSLEANQPRHGARSLDLDLSRCR